MIVEMPFHEKPELPEEAEARKQRFRDLGQKHAEAIEAAFWQEFSKETAAKSITE